jgi:23S rRNA pseudouridine1911/1915/1917 synthase
MSREPGEARTVPAELHGARADLAVRTLFRLTWGAARERIDRGKIDLDGAPLRDRDLRVAKGQKLDYRPDAPRPRRRLALARVELVYVDAHLAVVAKPPGIATVPFEGDDEGGVTLDRLVRDRLLALPGARTRDGTPPPPGLVHRLDRGTSGLIVFARTRKAGEGLKAQFREHTAHRRYLAVVHGKVEGRTFRSHLLVDRGDGLRGSSEREREQRGRGPRGGKLAVTHVTPLEALAGATLLGCRLETGRTNQIRIHLAEAGHPLVGETRYLRDFPGRPIPAPRLMLHAAELGFVHPATGEELRFGLPLPADMEAVIRSLRPGTRGTAG